MSTARTEAFSDGVIAVIITIMVLNLKTPGDTTLQALRAEVPTLLSYVLSFVYVGIYWNNHHHLMQASKKVNGVVLWMNLHWLFWLSLIPFVTNWVGQEPGIHHTTAYRLDSVPVAAYGVVLLCSGISFHILSRALARVHDRGSPLRKVLNDDRKGLISIGLYIVGIVIAFISPIAACSLYAAVAAMWFIPDRRFEVVVEKEEAAKN